MTGRPDLIKSAAARAEREGCARALETWAVMPNIDVLELYAAMNGMDRVKIWKYTLRLAAKWLREKRLSTTRKKKEKRT